MLTISTFNIQNKESKTKALDIIKYINEGHSRETTRK